MSEDFKKRNIREIEALVKISEYGFFFFKNGLLEKSIVIFSIKNKSFFNK